MAATVGIVNTNLMKLYIGGTVISCQVDGTLTVDGKTRDITCKDTAGWDAFLPGNLTWSMEGTFLYAVDASYGFEDILALMVAGAAVTVKFGSSNAGDNNWSGSGIITKASVNASGVGENVTGSVSVQGTGALTEAATV